MKRCRIPGLTKLRECYPSAEALGQVINRSRDYVQDRLTLKRQFTENEKRLILADLGEGFNEDIFRR